MLLCVWIVGAYLLGSVPWGVVIARTFCGIDPRQGGSKSTGATNVARLCGFGWGVATLACDLGKGALPVWTALAQGFDVTGVSAVAIASVVGHVCSCFMRFRGGKAVATSIGVFLPLAFWELLIASLLCIVVIWRSGYVSLGSLTLISALPLCLAANHYWAWLPTDGSGNWIPLALCLWAIIFWKHRENIARLRSGTEKSWIKSKHKEQA